MHEYRSDFPLLNADNAIPPVYFDNACMSLKPRRVLDAMNTYYTEYPACAGRSSHRLSEKATQKVTEARKHVARFLNSSREEEVVFVRNTTEAINLLAYSLNLAPGDRILTSDKEHNSNLVPWQIACERRGAVHSIVRSREDGTFDLEAFRTLVPGAKIVSMVHTSNLDGVSIPAKDIIKIAHEHGALVILDAAQSAPHQKIDVQDLDVDFVALSGHKMLGPTGTGVLYGKYELLQGLQPFLTGGDTVEYTTYEKHVMLPTPEKFEAGLQDYAGIIGLGEATRYVQKVGFATIQARELELNAFITNELKVIPAIRIIGPQDPALRSGIFNFYMPGVNMHQIALMLDETAQVMIRSGQHCVHSWFKDRGIENSARISVYFYNTVEEAKRCVDALKKISLLF